VALAIGPEGGWTAAEGQMFKRAGWVAASLGPTILRAETAAIAALAVVMAELQ
jgi:16S rRNA (uracil1498-N3)-methyltransferase